MPSARRSGRPLAILAIVSAALFLGAPGATATAPLPRNGPIVGGLSAAIHVAPPIVPDLAAAPVGTAPPGPATRPTVVAPKPPTAHNPPRTLHPPKVAPAPRPSFRGRNHVWMPGLGIDRSVAFFSCSSSAYPANRVYRWGCAGGNNVYLFGHAYGVFRPLHDAYLSGRLRTGLTLFYADGGGHVSRYVVSWWRVTTPDRGGFAYASQARPSLTLQTCVGTRSQYRLIVRLTRAG